MYLLNYLCLQFHYRENYCQHIFGRFEWHNIFIGMCLPHSIAHVDRILHAQVSTALSSKFRSGRRFVRSTWLVNWNCPRFNLYLLLFPFIPKSNYGKNEYNDWSLRGIFPFVWILKPNFYSVEMRRTAFCSISRTAHDGCCWCDEPSGAYTSSNEERKNSIEYHVPSTVRSSVSLVLQFHFLRGMFDNRISEKKSFAFINLWLPKCFIACAFPAHHLRISQLCAVCCLWWQYHCHCPPAVQFTKISCSGKI